MPNHERCIRVNLSCVYLYSAGVLKPNKVKKITLSMGQWLWHSWHSSCFLKGTAIPGSSNWILLSGLDNQMRLLLSLQNLYMFFCRDGLPLARSRWVWSTFSSHCPLSSIQPHWLTSATSIFFPHKKISWTLGIKPGAAGWEASMLPLCYAVPYAVHVFT